MDKNLSYLIKNRLGEDPNFSPERNKAIIDETIRANEQNVLRKRKEYDEAISERAEAVASYLNHLKNGKSSTVEKYFGRRMLAQLRGDDIRQKLMNAYAAQKS